MKFKIQVFLVRVSVGLLKLLGIDFHKVYLESLSGKNTLNKDLFSRDELFSGKGYYTSYLPDRYSFKFQDYKRKGGIFSFKDLNKWLEGNYYNNVGDLPRFFFLNLCIDYLIEEGIVGNVAELGVYKGNSAFLLAKYARKVGSNCYLFDTFEGFDARDIRGLDSEVKKESFVDTSLDYVRQIVGEENVTFVKGYFPESLSSVGEVSNLSIVHIDCDLEKPISESLNYFYPRMVSGGFLILHDHSSLFWEGSKNAIDTFFKNKPEFVIPIPDKSGTCVIRKL